MKFCNCFAILGLISLISLVSFGNSEDAAVVQPILTSGAYTTPILEDLDLPNTDANNLNDDDIDNLEVRGGAIGGSGDFGRKLLYLLPLLFVLPLLFLFCKRPHHEYYHYPAMMHHHGWQGHGHGHGHEEYYDAGQSHGGDDYYKKVGIDHYLTKGSNLINSLSSKFGSTDLLNKLNLKG